MQKLEKQEKTDAEQIEMYIIKHGLKPIPDYYRRIILSPAVLKKVLTCFARQDAEILS